MTTTSSTPSQTSSLQSGTPFHSRYSTTGGYVKKREDRDKVLSRLGNEMAPFVVGPISADAFLKSFLPPPAPPPDSPSFTDEVFKSYRDLLKKVNPKANETQLYAAFITDISKYLPNLILKRTCGSSDQAPSSKFPNDIKPDCTVYDISECEKNASDTYLDSSRADFVIEFKRCSQSKDPFGDDSIPFMPPISDALMNLGQLTAYATSILSAQYRTHTFTVLIFNDYARLIRWDRSGAIFTKQIPLEEPYLFDFLIRYNYSDREARGHDITVCRASSRDAKLARNQIPGWPAGECLDVTTSLGHFIIPSPGAIPDIPVGRWTRASLAYDKQSGRRVLLKDSWRVLHESVMSEGYIYGLLHKKNVPNIPSYLLGEDVGNATYHRTRTAEIINDKNFELHKHRSHWNLTSHRHYRIVLQTVGKKLEEFNCTREFVRAMYAALKAHEAAYEAGVLHRDISPGNIMIFSEGERSDSDDPNELRIDGGMLIDWDLSKVNCENDKHNTTRRHARTGTWQFMAADLVEKFNIRQTFAHDLESFFWVLLWIILTRVKIDYDDAARSTFIKTTMNPKVCGNSGGAERKIFLVARMIFGKMMTQFQMPDNPSLCRLVKDMKVTVADRYLVSSDEADEDTLPEDISKGLMKDYRAVNKVFEEAVSLSSPWPSGDKAVLCPVMRSTSDYGASRSGTKRLWSEFIQQGDSDQPRSKRQA